MCRSILGMFYWRPIESTDLRVSWKTLFINYIQSLNVCMCFCLYVYDVCQCVCDVAAGSPISLLESINEEPNSKTSYIQSWHVTHLKRGSQQSNQFSTQNSLQMKHVDTTWNLNRRYQQITNSIIIRTVFGAIIKYLHT